MIILDKQEKIAWVLQRRLENAKKKKKVKKVEKKPEAEEETQTE